MRVRAALAALLLGIATSPAATASEFTVKPCLSVTPEDAKALASDAALTSAVSRSRTLRTEAIVIDRSVDLFRERCNRPMVKGSPEETSCASEQAMHLAQIAQHDARTRTFDREVDALAATTEPKVVQRLKALRVQLDRTSARGKGWSGDIDEWLRIGEDARQAARAQAFETAVNLVIDGGIEKLKHNAGLEQSTRDSLQQWFAERGQAFPPGLRAEIERRLARARSYHDVAGLLRYIYLQHAAAYQAMNATAGAPDAIAEAIVSFVAHLPPEIGLGREAQLLLDVVQLGEKDLYGVVAYFTARGRIEELLALQEQQFEQMKGLSRAYIATVKLDALLKRFATTCRR
jgi:hypothetical protein